MDRTIDQQVLREASRWHARLSAGDCSADDRAKCEAWLACDSLHRLAFERVRQVESVLEQMAPVDRRLQELAERAFSMGAGLNTGAGHHESNAGDPGLNDAEVCSHVSEYEPFGAYVSGESGNSADFDKGEPVLRQAAEPIAPCAVCVLPSQSGSRSVSRLLRRAASKSNPPRQRRFGSLSAAAAVLLLAATVGWQLRDRVTDAPELAAKATLFDAPARESRRIELQDGTQVSIDAGSRIRVTMNEHGRNVELLQGRAYFDVAHDTRRPFAVTANGVRTVALGTRFEVDRNDVGAVVSLAQGSVAVSGTRHTDTSADAWEERLQPGEQLVTRNDAIPIRHNVAIPDIAGWSRGWLIFDATPLDEALDQINRYSTRRVVVADAELSQLSVSGRFVTGDAQSIVNAIAEVLPIRVVDGGAHEIILFRRYDN